MSEEKFNSSFGEICKKNKVESDDNLIKSWKDIPNINVKWISGKIDDSEIYDLFNLVFQYNPVILDLSQIKFYFLGWSDWGNYKNYWRNIQVEKLNNLLIFHPPIYIPQEIEYGTPKGDIVVCGQPDLNRVEFLSFKDQAQKNKTLKLFLLVTGREDSQSLLASDYFHLDLFRLFCDLIQRPDQL